MRIIDLLNKIAKGEEVPKEIYYKKQWWKYNPENDYEGTDWGGCFLNNVLICDLNDEIEIIEEEKEIEEISNEHDFYCYTEYEAYKNEIDKVLYIIRAINNVNDRLSDTNNKINKLVRKLNKIKKEGK